MQNQQLYAVYLMEVKLKVGPDDGIRVKAYWDGNSYGLYFAPD